MPLTSKDKRRLRQKAHHLKPVIIIGSKGLSDAVDNEIDVALTAHELIKVKVNDHDKTDIQAMVPIMCMKHHAEHVQTIGHTITIWRENTE